MAGTIRVRRGQPKMDASHDARGARDRVCDAQSRHRLTRPPLSGPADPRSVPPDVVEAACAHGLAACRRRRRDGPSPREADAELAARACRSIEASERNPSLADLAAAAGRSPGHFHRLFKAATGVTPKGYALAHRAARVREELLQEGTVTKAFYGAGFGSSSRFYSKSNEMLGMTPTKYRAFGLDEKIRFAVGRSALGAVLAASSGTGVVAISIGDDPDALVRDLQDRFSKAHLEGGQEDYEDLVAKIVGLAEAQGLRSHLPRDIRGTAFRRLVWQALRKMPAGRAMSYADIAALIDVPQAVRAAAHACAANDEAVDKPCHRVVRVDDASSLYAWRVEGEHTSPGGVAAK